MESISRISSLLDTARDLTLEASRDAGLRRNTRQLPTAQIKKLLDSRNEREVLDGLRRVVALQYANPPQPTLTFFPAVLKTLSNPSPSTRPLVYCYLVQHAEADPDTALLGINTIQKSLSDANPRVRAMSLKTMAAIRVPVISQIVSLAIKKGVSDTSPLVRKAAAFACVKCVRLDPSTRPQAEEYLGTLLADKQYYVAGAAVQAFMEVCPDKLDLIHSVYRSLCKILVDMDEWAQLATMRLMTVYARRCFPRRTKRVRRAPTQEEKAKEFYEDLELKEENDDDFEETELIDPDLELFLSSTKPLLQSRNSAVIVAVTRAYLYLSPSSALPDAVGPLMALLRSALDVRESALYNIVQVCLHDPRLIVPYTRHFFLHSSEALQVQQLKLEVLTLVFPFSGRDVQALILSELEHFSRVHDPDLVRESVRAIGHCAQASEPQTARSCLALLLKQIHSPDQHLVGEAMEVIRHLIQRAPDEHRKTVVRLAKNLDTLTSPTARASIIWLVGEYAAGEGESGNDGIAADVLRILTRGYADESEEVRGQICLLAAKVYLHYLNATNAKRKALEALDSSHQSATTAADLLSSSEELQKTVSQFDSTSQKADPVEALWNHTMLLARYTPSYSLRDRARLYRSLLAVPSSTELASLLLLAPKPVPLAPSPSEARKDFLLGSASLVIGECKLKGQDTLPEWVREGEEPDPKLRDDGAAAAVSVEKGTAKSAAGAVAAGRKLDEALAADAVVRKGKTLDDWLDEEDEEETESGEGSTMASESSESEEESEYETESEEDEEAGLVR